MLGALANAFVGLRKLLGRSFRSWSTWAEKNPGAAALQLDAIATVLEHRASSRRRPSGWLAKRERTMAGALREHADALRDEKARPAACQVRPGEWLPEAVGLRR